VSQGYLSFEDFIKMILTVLDRAGIDYLIGGAVAAWAWGEPRSTQDLDLVIHLSIEQATILSKELEQVEIYLPAEIFVENIYETRADLPINAIHGTSGYKAEMFLVRETDELRKLAFQRRVKVDFGPVLGEVFVHSPEDLILYKMLYYSLSQQTKHIRDIGAIIGTMDERLDYSYIQKWARQKDLTTIWETIQKELGIEGRK
jgi:hypothetical protein